MKTYAGWQASGLQLHPSKYTPEGFLDIGDQVDQAFADWWLDVLPPCYWSRTIRQIGEAASSDAQGRNLYSTIALVGGKWTYMGECLKGHIVAGAA